MFGIDYNPHAKQAATRGRFWYSPAIAVQHCPQNIRILASIGQDEGQRDQTDPAKQVASPVLFINKLAMAGVRC
jgi:hypothetical protein